MNRRELLRILRKLEGQVFPNHDESGHYYVYDSVRLPSVTTKMKYFADADLKTWAARLAAQAVYEERDKLDTEWERIYKKAFLAHASYTSHAANTGTVVHDAIEKFLNKFINKEVEAPVEDLFKLVPAEDRDSRVLFALRSAHSFLTDHFVIPLAPELLVASKEHRYGGTFDLLALVDGKLTFVDWKTSNDPRKEKYSMQVAAYKYAFQEMTGVEVERSVIVGLSKAKDRYSLFEPVDDKKAFEAFLAVAMLYDLFEDGTLKPLPANQKEVISLL